MNHPLPASAHLNQFKKAAKQLLKSYQQNPATVTDRIRRQCPDDATSDFKLADSQRVIAREYGFVSWAKLKSALDTKSPAERVIDAAAGGHTALIDLILRDDASLIHTRGGWQQYGPLFFALKEGHDDTADFLRDQGAELDVFEAAALGSVHELKRILTVSPALAHAKRDHYDATPLHAVRGAGADAARFLLENGADVNAIDSERQRLTPLHGRAEHGDVAMVTLLLEHGADIHAESCMGTPLHAAVGGFQHKPPKTWRDVAEILLEHGADVNARSNPCEVTDWTPLHHAAWRDHIEAVTWLLEKGADVNAINGAGHTPLKTAEIYSGPDIQQILTKATP